MKVSMNNTCVVKLHNDMTKQNELLNIAKVQTMSDLFHTKYIESLFCVY